jgi:hypothetical protein
MTVAAFDVFIRYRITLLRVRPKPARSPAAPASAGETRVRETRA